ncbi:MAG TPA: hypothetical protein VD866_23460 [Urbifossiella sp.]|nr:hypothetical protein [Urbifossiella sp.]
MAIEHVVRGLRRKFRSRVHGEDDTDQQIRLLCLQVLPKYRPEVGKLEGFLYRAVRNRMMNEARAEYGRVADPECRVCFDRERGRGPGHAGGQPCDTHLRWKARNEVIRNLAHPAPMQSVSEEHESRTRVAGTAEADAVGRELSLLIDSKLPVGMREDYLKMLAGVPVETLRRRRVKQAVAAILGRDDLLEDHEQQGVPRTTPYCYGSPTTRPRWEDSAEVPQDVEQEVVGSRG